MPKPEYEILTQDDQRELAKRKLRLLEETMFAAEFEEAANSGNEEVTPEGQELSKKRLRMAQRGLVQTRVKYKHLLSSEPEE